MLVTRRHWAYIGAIFMWIVGLPGLIANTKTWSEWLSSIEIEHNIWNYVFLILGAIMFLYASCPSKRQRVKKPNALAEPITKPGASTERDRIQTRETDGSAEPEKKPIELGRIYTQRSAVEILTAVRELTSVEVEQYARPHLGKWIRMQSIIKNISFYGDDKVCVTLGHWFDPRLMLIFAKNEWWSRLETMNKGDRLAAVEMISRIGSNDLDLDQCEIVKLATEDDIFRPDRMGLLC